MKNKSPESSSGLYPSCLSTFYQVNQFTSTFANSFGGENRSSLSFFSSTFVTLFDVFIPPNSVDVIMANP